MTEETFVAPCLLPLWRIRVLAAESAWALVSDEALVKESALAWRWLLVLEWELYLGLVLDLQSHPKTPH